MTTTPPLPERLGRYPVQRVIGSGAMGVVYLGFDPQINRPVAIKTIRRQLLGHEGRDLDAPERFRIEAQAAGRLNHPGIVTVYDVGEDVAAECAYIAMEYVAGHSLREYLTQEWRFGAGESVSIVCQLLDALGAAHAKGVLHRDIKPANLLISDTGHLKVTDFGIARIDAGPGTLTGTLAPSEPLTRAQSVLGTPGYMAPEQYTGGPLDHRVDVFAAGILLYRLLSGRMPYVGTDQAVTYQVIYGDPDPLCHTPEEAALARFEPIVQQALARHPDQRFASAADFRQRLLSIAPTGWRPAPLPAERMLPLTEPPPVRPRSGATGSVSVPTGWNEATLVGIERELARIIGPIAVTLVRRTAAQTSTLEVLRQRVAPHIPDPQQRAQFLSSGGTRLTTAHPATRTLLGAREAARDTPPPRTATGGRLTPTDVEAAAVAMAASFGPLAKLLARRCAAQATTREQFVELVLQQAGPHINAETLQARLWNAWT